MLTRNKFVKPINHTHLHTHTHTLSLSHTHTHPHPHTHPHTLTHTLSHTCLVIFNYKSQAYSLVHTFFNFQGKFFEVGMLEGLELY